MMTDCDVNVFKAVERGNVRKLNEFLVSGGRKGIQKTDPKFNATLLHWASLRNQVDCMEICIEAGADLEAKTNTSGTPLMWACMEGSAHAVEVLLRHGADINAATTSLATPLHHATSYGHAEVVSILLLHGADPIVEDVYKSRPGDNFVNGVTKDSRRKVAQELERARERSSVVEKQTHGRLIRRRRSILLRKHVRKDEGTLLHIYRPDVMSSNRGGKCENKYDSSLLRASHMLRFIALGSKAHLQSPSDVTVSIKDLIYSLDEKKAVAKTVLEELKESEAAVVAAITARKNCGEKYDEVVEAMEAATSALALALHSREQRLMCLESDLKSREMELKSALESKENEDKLTYRSEVSGTRDSTWSVTSQERMDINHVGYSKGYDAVAGYDREKKDKGSQIEELEIPRCGHLPEATEICGIPTSTRALSWHEQGPSIHEDQAERGYPHDMVRSGTAPVVDDASAVEHQSKKGWQSSDDISEIPYLYSLLATGK